MSDLISRQAAIEHLKKRLYETALNNVTEHPYYEDMADNRVSVWLEEVPSAQQERWIPVSERLPKAATDVLVCNDDQKQAVAIMQTQDFYGHTMKEWYIKYCLYDWDVWDENADGKIVAWMPLPEPYKEGKDERT